MHLPGLRIRWSDATEYVPLSFPLSAKLTPAITSTTEYWDDGQLVSYVTSSELRKIAPGYFQLTVTYDRRSNLALPPAAVFGQSVITLKKPFLKGPVKWTGASTRGYNGTRTWHRYDPMAEAIEGTTKERRTYVKGRNRKLRALALAGATGRCECCNVNYAAYLPDQKGLSVLEVHHRNQLALTDAPVLTTVNDLAVVCANCHALLHMNPKRALTVSALKNMLRRR